nr:MAG TPA: hypothetical protein [Caudoviricetes sp.]
MKKFNIIKLLLLMKYLLVKKQKRKELLIKMQLTF